MTTKEDMRQICSKEVYDALQAFNALTSIEEQEEVLDVIYDAFYHRSYKEVMKDRKIQHLKMEMASLKQENEDLLAENEMLKHELQSKESMIFTEGKKQLRATKKGLLIIVNNLKHYLGESWYSIFPGGMDNVEAFLEKVDNGKIMGQDTWSQYLPKNSNEDPMDSYEENEEEYF